MYRYFIILLIVCLFPVFHSQGQPGSDTTHIKQWLKARIDSLAAPAMFGRGYVSDGRRMASKYIQRQFKSFHVAPAGKKKTIVQTYSFPVNTFPGKVRLAFNGKTLKPGRDYIIDASSHSFSGAHLAVEKIDLSKIGGNDDWQQIIAHFQPNGKVYYLDNIDSACHKLGIRKHFLPFVLPRGCYMIAQKEKFTWDVECEAGDATIFYVNAAAIPTELKSIDACVQAKFLPDAPNDNIVGVLKGKIKDTFVAFIAHYDHLGMMGSKTIFPGASDNASGTAMLLYLAKYYSTHPHHYSILFISFSGEEPGMLGSEYFTRHPSVPLSQIKFLINMDIMGDATDGITVVNATEFPDQFKLLQQINSDHNYLPQVVSRGKSAKSDHYYFTEAGVPSFFIYSNGGKGYYHDIYDKAREITLQHVGSIAHLLIDFVAQIK